MFLVRQWRYREAKLSELSEDTQLVCQDLNLVSASRVKIFNCPGVPGKPLEREEERLPSETCSGLVWDNIEKKSFVEGPLLLMIT